VDDTSYEFLRPLVTGWVAKIQAALNSPRRKEFDDVCDQCMSFFSGAVGWMWEEKYRRKFVGGKLAPKFRITLAKAFELVAVVGPLLYHRNPVRAVRPFPEIQYDPEAIAQALGIPAEQLSEWGQMAEQAQQAMAQGQPLDPQVQQGAMLYEQSQAQIRRLLGQDKAERAATRVACRLMEKYLSYTPLEQPNGGLEQAAEDAITEMFIYGRGVLWVQPYTMPGSERILTGCFHDNARNLVTDPDAESINFGETKWVARKHLEPWWEVERRFRLPYGSLRKAARLESSEAQAARRTAEFGNLERERGNTKDLVRWWEIWSLAGAGPRMSGFSPVMGEAFDTVVGDYAYLCVCEGYPAPLNAPTERIRTATDDEVREMFSWPIPYYVDQRWPFALLETYREPGNSYPIAPLKPGLGELTFLNLILSHVASRLWTSSRTILGVLDSARAYVERQLQSGEDLCVLGIKDIHGDITKIVKEFQFKELSYDVWRVVDRISEIFDRRVGLTDLMFGMNPGGAASRSATDVKAKTEKLSVRPDHMSKKIDGWMREAARMEKLCAYWAGVSGEHVRPLMGTLGALLWDKLVVQADPERIIREMDATVENGTARKPNRDRDAANMGQIYQPLSQQFTAYAQLTGDAGPLNALNAKMFESIEQEASGLEMGDWAPPPPPPGSPNPAEVEMQAKQMELQAKRAEAQTRQAEGAAEVRQREQEHRQKLRHRAEEHKQKIRLQQAQSRMKRIKSQ
jgi:hypothetical protein